MNHDGALILACTASGHVRRCAAGCLHLTFEHATLHFPQVDDFEAMAQAVAVAVGSDLTQTGEAFDLHHGWFSISLSPQGAVEFTQLVFEAIAEIAWLRGDYEFTDDDLRQIHSGYVE